MTCSVIAPCCMHFLPSTIRLNLWIRSPTHGILRWWCVRLCCVCAYVVCARMLRVSSALLPSNTHSWSNQAPNSSSLARESFWRNYFVSRHHITSLDVERHLDFNAIVANPHSTRHACTSGKNTRHRGRGRGLLDESELLDLRPTLVVVC